MAQHLIPSLAMAEAASPFNYFDSGGSLLLGKSPESIDRVESLLTSLWSRQTGSADVYQTLYRLCLANLVVVGHIGDQEMLESFAANFASYHPSRVQLALFDPNAPDLSARLAASCRRNPSGTGAVCWEKITLVCPPREEEQLTSAVRALLIGRIATVIAFAVPPDSCRTVFDRALHWADLIVTDLQRPTVVPELLYWDSQGCRASRTRWIDANWARLKGMRQSISRAFDHPETRTIVERGSDLEVTVAGLSAPLNVMCAGWLISRLGWSMTGRTSDGRVVLRRPSGHGVFLSFQTAGSPSVTFNPKNGQTAKIDLPGIEGTDTGESQWESPNWPLSLIEELRGIRPDPVFLTAMDAASQMQKSITGQYRKPAINVCHDAGELADRAAAHFVQLAREAVHRSGLFRVVLSGGRTPQLLYERLAAPEFRSAIPWNQIEWFWGDERWVPHSHPDSNYGMARRALLDRVPASDSQVYPVPTGLATVEEAAETYDTTLREAAGRGGSALSPFDLVLLGIGTDGHTASWFPQSPIDQLTYRWMWGGYVPQLGTERVSITPRAINAARHIVFLAAGTEKAAIVARTIYPPWENRHPAARIEPHHGEIEWFLDRDAAAGIDL